MVCCPSAQAGARGRAGPPRGGSPAAATLVPAQDGRVRRPGLGPQLLHAHAAAAGPCRAAQGLLGRLCRTTLSSRMRGLPSLECRLSKSSMLKYRSEPYDGDGEVETGRKARMRVARESNPDTTKCLAQGMRRASNQHAKKVALASPPILKCHQATSHETGSLARWACTCRGQAAVVTVQWKRCSGWKWSISR